jgi:hypothetical protein
MYYNSISDSDFQKFCKIFAIRSKPKVLTDRKSRQGQKIANNGLMRAQVITDDMHGLLLGLACDEIFQKRDELCTGVAGAGLAKAPPSAPYQNVLSSAQRNPGHSLPVS